MERITVFADFDFLTQPEEIGVLGYERVRGNDHFAFEFSREWLRKLKSATNCLSSVGSTN